MTIIEPACTERRAIRVYLSGPMYLGKQQATSWRDEVKEILKQTKSQCFKYEPVDPCNRFFDDKEFLTKNGSWVVKIDKMEIDSSHVVMVNATEPGWGTPMENYIAYDKGKFVISFDDKPFSSIWTKAHSHVVVDSHINAAKWLVENIEQIGGTLHAVY